VTRYVVSCWNKIAGDLFRRLQLVEIAAAMG
jgi:hypothetical protein